MIALALIFFTYPPPVVLHYRAPVAVAHVAAGIDAGKVLAAIATVENWQRGKVGSSGEVGKFQILPSTWRKYSRVSQWSAPESEQRRVALAIVRDIRAGLRRAGLPESVRLIATAWNGGLSATVQGRASQRARDYAQRCENIFEDL